MSMSAGPVRFSIPENVLFQQLDDEAVILALDSGEYYGLDEVGTRCWRLLAEHGRLERVTAELRQVYDAPRERLERDLLRLVVELEERGLVRADRE